LTSQPAGTGTAGETPAPSPARKAAAPVTASSETRKAPAPDPEPVAPVALEVMTVVMANATHGARYPGAVVTLEAETGRALVRAGEASPA